MARRINYKLITQPVSCIFLSSLPIYEYFYQRSSLRTRGKISHPQKMTIYFEWFAFMIFLVRDRKSNVNWWFIDSIFQIMKIINEHKFNRSLNNETHGRQKSNDPRNSTYLTCCYIRNTNIGLVNQHHINKFTVPLARQRNYGKALNISSNATAYTNQFTWLLV
jgi:hypothetical protein